MLCATYRIGYNYEYIPEKPNEPKLILVITETRIFKQHGFSIKQANYIHKVDTMFANIRLPLGFMLLELHILNIIIK